jgi:hypothetical protein
MTRHDRDVGLLRRAGWLPLWLLGGLGAVLLVLAGCASTSQQRGKADDEPEAARYDLPTVGEKTTVANAEPMMLGGVGLVEGLQGTGGDCAHDSYRAMLYERLRKDNVPDVNKLLKSPDCAVVIVEAAIPPGTPKGGHIDVEIKLPPGSRATSLRGGVLAKTPLYNYDFARNLRPDYNGPQSMLQGHKLAEAAGAVLVGGGEGEDAPGPRQGRIWQGARTLAEQPLALVMNPDSQQARLTSLISERINTTFQPGTRGGDSTLAHTTDNLAISLRVPPQYRHNLPRYLRVVRVVPLSDSPDFVPREPKENDDKRSYRQKLGDDLLEPSRTIVAALRLEALGNKSIPTLKAGLKSPHPLVRFSSAEALAYLGSAAGCEELGRAAAKYPIVRSYVLSALASLDEAASVLQLRKLIVSDLDDEVRAGAFRALQLLNDRDPLVRGEQLNESFWLHAVAPQTRPFVHVSTQTRAEVVLFGQTPTLRPPFSLLAGEFTVTGSAEGATATISWVAREGRTARKVCSLELDEVIRGMADLGASFPEVLALLQQAASCDAVSCPVRIDALPQPASAHELAQMGKDDPSGQMLLPAGEQGRPDAGTR